MSETIDIKKIESEYLKARIETINAKTGLDEDEKLKRSILAIQHYIVATLFLRSLLSIFTLFTIWPIYNAWASKHGRESRWFTLKEDNLLKEINLKKSETNASISQECEENYSDSSENNEGSKSENNADSEEKNISVIEVPVDPDPSEVAENAAVKVFIDKKADQRKFKTWYSSDTTRVLLNMPKNWSQCIRVQFNDSDDDNNTDTFALQLSQLIKMSHEFHRPAVFIAKQPGASIHFIAGLYFNNKVLIIDPMGSTAKKIAENEDLVRTFDLIKAENASLSLFVSSTVIQHDPEDDGFAQTVSCGPLVSEIVMHLSTKMTRADLEGFFATLQTEFVDIEDILPDSLVELIDEDNESEYEEKVVTIRAEHHALLLDIPPAKNTDAFLNELENSVPQVIFEHLLLNHGDMNDVAIREVYNKLVREVGTPPKRDHLQFVNSFQDCDYGSLPVLGSGTCADTVKYEAKDQTLAVKSYKKGTSANFKKECDILFTLKHENIIQYFYCGNYQSIFNYIALEYAEMGDLESLIENSLNFAPPWKLKFKIARDLGSGLSYLHDTAKIIHRDLKSPNILLTWTQGNLSAKIADFDLSTSLVTYNYQAVGTPLYISPEVYAKFYPKLNKHADIETDVHSEKSDVYAYGVIMWEIGTWTVVGQHHHKTQRSYGAQILSGSRIEKPEAVKHEGLAILIGQCWNNRHKERPSAQEVVESVLGLTS